MTHRLTVTIPDDLRRTLDRWTTRAHCTDDTAVCLALRIMLYGEPHPPVPLTSVKKPGSEGAD